MQDDEFFSLLYQQWSKTTGAQDQYWMPEEDEGQWAGLREDDYFIPGEGCNIYAVAEDQTRKLVASHLSNEDAEFLTSLHGCLPDLIRRLGSAIDETDRLDTALDEEINRVGAQVLEIMELKQIIQDLEGKLAKAAEPSFQRDFTAYHAADTVYPFGRQP